MKVKSRRTDKRHTRLPASRAAEQVAQGNGFLAHGRWEQAIDCYVRAIELQPDYMDAHNNLAAVLMAQGLYDAVAMHFKELVRAKPDSVSAHNTLALALMAGGKPDEALEYIRHGLDVGETPEGKLLFVRAVGQIPAKRMSSHLQPLLLRALSEPWGRPADLTRACIAVITAQPAMAACFSEARGSLFSADVCDALARNPLLQCLLENVRVDDAHVERVLTGARRWIFEQQETAIEGDADRLVFACVLARQCFINEYVFACTDTESAHAEALRAEISDRIRTGQPISPASLAKVAAYFPLSQIDGLETRLLDAWPPCVYELLTYQVREPARERALRNTILRLTPIEDPTSLRVQEQYEEHPYPRWVKAAPAGDARPLDARLRGQFPFAGFRDVGCGSMADVLIAGCGTGQQIIELGRRIAGARILAIDLSLSSLAYAKRQMEALHVTNVDFGQADILQIGSLGRSFDVIDCGGVLHHMHAPLAGWRALLSVLRPNGVMRIALYSDTARQSVVAARAFASARGYCGTAEDIRRFRQDVLTLPCGDLVREIATSPDFFSTSECRDLVFHVQEHRFRLAQIKDFLEQENLLLLGFEADQRSLALYAAAFPDDHVRTDLDRWAFLEARNFDMFAGMYQFWVQRRI